MRHRDGDRLTVLDSKRELVDREVLSLHIFLANRTALRFWLDVITKDLQQIPIKPATKELPQRLKADATMMKPIKSIFISNSINRHSDS